MLFASDTSPEARQALLAVLRRKTPAERARMISDAIMAARQLARAGVRRHSPEASVAAQHAAFLRRWSGPELADVVFAEWQRRRSARAENSDDRSR